MTAFSNQCQNDDERRSNTLWLKWLLIYPTQQGAVTILLFARPIPLFYQECWLFWTFGHWKIVLKHFVSAVPLKLLNRNPKHFDVLMCIFTGNSDSIISLRVFSKKKTNKKLTFAIIEYTTEIVLQCNYSEPLIE